MHAYHPVLTWLHKRSDVISGCHLAMVKTSCLSCNFSCLSYHQTEMLSGWPEECEVVRKFLPRGSCSVGPVRTRVRRVCTVFQGFDTCWFKRWSCWEIWVQCVGWCGGLFSYGFWTLGFSVAKSATFIAQYWKVFIHYVLPKDTNFYTFRQWVGHVYLDTDSSVSSSNGGTSNDINF